MPSRLQMSFRLRIPLTPLKACRLNSITVKKACHGCVARAMHRFWAPPRQEAQGRILLTS